MKGLKCQNGEVKHHCEDSCEPPAESEDSVVFQGRVSDGVHKQDQGGKRSVTVERLEQLTGTLLHLAKPANS